MLATYCRVCSNIVPTSNVLNVVCVYHNASPINRDGGRRSRRFHHAIYVIDHVNADRASDCYRCCSRGGCGATMTSASSPPNGRIAFSRKNRVLALRAPQKKKERKKNNKTKKTKTKQKQNQIKSKNKQRHN